MNSWNPFSYPPRAVLKSVWAFFLPAAAIILDALRDNGKVTGTDWGVAVLTAIITGYGVFAVANTPPGEVTPGEADRGYAGVGLLLFVVGAILIVVALLGLFGVLAISTKIVLVLVVIGVLCVVFGSRSGTPV